MPYSYLSLFISAFLAATLLPVSSEILLATLLKTTHSSAVLLFIAATLGNTLGSCVNWYLGRYLERFKDKKWFPVSEQQLNRARQAFNRYGYYSLLLSWVPIIGDPLTVIAGFLRMPFLLFVLIVLIAKSTRYAFIIWLFIP